MTLAAVVRINTSTSNYKLKSTKKGSKSPKKTHFPRNKTSRPRGEWLTPGESLRVIAAAKTIEPGGRNQLLVLMGLRHGLRATELLETKWSQIDLERGFIRIQRLKGGTGSTQEILKDELALLRKHYQTRQKHHDYIFHSTHGSRITVERLWQIVKEAGKRAGLPFPIHSHMLRHSAGYKLVNDGTDLRVIQGFLGHVNAQHTSKYTELSEKAFLGVWKE